MLLREPENHLVAHKDAELLFHFTATFGFCETACDRHESGGEEAFCGQGAHEVLDVGGEAEGDGVGVVEEWLSGDEGRDEFGAPYVSCAAGDGEFVGVAGGDVHGVCDESEGGHLVRELFAEEEEVCEGGIGGLEVVEGDVCGDPFCADGGVDFCAEGGVVGWIWRRVGRVGTELVHCEEKGVVFVEGVAATVVFVNSLE